MSAVLRLPEVLTGTEEAILSAWRVRVGQEVEVGQPVADLETDKAMIEYVADAAGVVAELLAEPSATIAVGTPILLLATGGESIDDARASVTAEAPTAGTPPTPPEAAASLETPPSPEAPPTPPAVKPAARNGNERINSSPIVRRLAAERGLDLAHIEGTGPGGRIVRRDVERLGAPASHIDEASVGVPTRPAPSQSAPQSTPPTGATVVPLTPMRKAIARRLTHSKATVPHFYLTAYCRVDELIALRKQVNDDLEQRLSLNDFVVKAVAGVLADVPEMNAQWSEDGIVRFEQVDVGIAVALDDGLVTPVVRDAAARSVSDLSAAMKDLAQRARSRSLRQDELEGGSFTVSNLGMFGITDFAAIINPPQAGILAVGAASPRPVVLDGELAVGSVMTVTLSADHRVVDGAAGARWLQEFVRRVEHPMSIVI